MLTLDNVKSQLSEDNGLIVNASIFNYENSFKTFSVFKEINVLLSNQQKLTIPQGFKHDKSSILKVLSPFLFLATLFQLLAIKSLFWLIPSLIITLGTGFMLYKAFDRTDLAAIIHDYLYREGKVSREFADKEFRLWLMAMNGTSKSSLNNLAINLMYYGVRFAGIIKFKKSQ